MVENIERNRVTPSIQGVGFGTNFDVQFWDVNGNPIDAQFAFVMMAAPGPAAPAAAAASRSAAPADVALTAPQD